MILVEIAAGLYILSWVFGALTVFNTAFPMTTGSNAPPFKWTPWSIAITQAAFEAIAGHSRSAASVTRTRPTRRAIA